MRYAPTKNLGTLHWDLIACGPEGAAPFRLVLYYAHGSIAEYFMDLASAFEAIDKAEKGVPDLLVPGTRMIGIPDEGELIKQCCLEEVWASAARH